jgi:hypothetical protein
MQGAQGQADNCHRGDEESTKYFIRKFGFH